MVVRLEFVSTFEMLDFVQIVSDHIGQRVGLDDDTQHYVGVAVRECVINAITHGNRNDPAKHIFVEFSAENTDGTFELASGTDTMLDAGPRTPTGHSSSPSGSAIRVRASIPRWSPIRWRRRTC